MAPGLVEPSAEDEMRQRAFQYTMFTYVQIPHLDLWISYSVRARADGRLLRPAVRTRS